MRIVAVGTGWWLPSNEEPLSELLVWPADFGREAPAESGRVCVILVGEVEAGGWRVLVVLMVVAETFSLPLP